MKRIQLLPLTLFVLSCVQAHATQLIGIYTNTRPSDKIKIMIEGDPREQGIEGQPYQANIPLPARIKVNYNKGGRTLTKTISIRENQGETFCAGKEIIAEIEGYPNLTKTVCISDSLNRSIRSLPTKVFQNLLLVISSVSQSTGESVSTESDLPFTFGISAWSSTKSPWNAKTIAAPISDPSSKFTAFGIPQRLNILQGYNAWGAGTQPPLDYANIMHIYNNTPFSLIIKRTASSAEKNQPWKYFNKVVPPFSAIPWASIWIPKADSSAIAQTRGDVPEISFVVISPPVKEPLPPAFEEQTYALGEQLPAEVANYNEILKDMEQNVPTFVEETTGQPSLSKYMIDRTAIIGMYAYKMVTDAQENSVKLIKCRVLNLKDKDDKQVGIDIDDCQIIQKLPYPATDGRFPNFFELIINSASGNDLEDSLKFELKPIDETKL